MKIRTALGSVIVAIVMMALTDVAGSDEISDCNSFDAARRISGCSKLIAAGDLDNEMLALTYENRGIAYFSTGKTDLALADFTTAIRLNPKGATAFQNRGNAYLRLRRLIEAKDDLNAALAINPDSRMPWQTGAWRG